MPLKGAARVRIQEEIDSGRRFKHEGPLADFMDESTFHGPYHAAIARNKTEFGFWWIMFMVFLGLALYHGSLVVMTYLHERGYSRVVESEIRPDLVSRTLHFTVCPLHWLDKKKVDETIAQGNITYSDVLFALSLMENLDIAVLQEMEYWDIPDAHRIWGIQKESCKQTTDTQTTDNSGSLLGLGGGTDGSTNLIGNIVDTVSNTLVSVTGDVVDTIMDPRQAMEEGKIREMLSDVNKSLCDRPQCRTDQMQDWKAHSANFSRNARKMGIHDLTEFFAHCAVSENPMEQLGAKRVRYEIYAGQLCQIVSVNTSWFQGGKLSGTTKLADSLEAFFATKDVKGVVGSKVFIAMPFAVRTRFGEARIWSDLKTRVDSSLPVVSILTGRQPVFQTDFEEVKKIKRKVNCEVNPPDLPNPPLGYASRECKELCRQMHTKDAGGSEEKYQVVSANSQGRIQLKDKLLAPGRFLTMRPDNKAIQNCIMEEECEKKSYCEELKVTEPIPISSGILPSLDKCGQSPSEMLNKFHFTIRIMKTKLAENKSEMNISDFISMIGGILGLYMGCSVFTIVHTVIFMFQRCLLGWMERKKAGVGIQKAQGLEAPEKNASWQETVSAKARPSVISLKW